ncbi:mucin-12 isoform X2 [Bombus pyrosoma]|uniref:mucin-12 isoform X2 n=1 Tax=Bombus pyrosoma TaxID=396416 RepID=UPI001CB96929|nr:mucin-12 isoform X2 [Bombus pyrosoma]
MKYVKRRMSDRWRKSGVSESKKKFFLHRRVFATLKLTRSANRASDLEKLGAHARTLVLRCNTHSRAKRKVDRVSTGQAATVWCHVSRLESVNRRSFHSTREISRRNEKRTTERRNGHILLQISDYPFSRDALLEDLQTSVSRSATPSRGGRALSPQVEYRVAANPTKVVSEGRTMTTTTEKYVSTGPSGAPSGIPDLNFIDSELQNVQPGQSKTIAYKQVSYQYNKSLDGKPIDSWVADNALTNTSSALIDDIRERSYEESTIPRGLEPVGKSVNRELVYNDSSVSRSKQTSPLPAGTQRDVRYIHESSSYQTEPAQNTTVTTTVHANAAQEYGNVEYVPVPSPTAAIPINLAPGPNTKVTTTIKTYTYELPGPPETYLPGGNAPGTVVLPGDQTITYTIPKGTSSTDKTITYQTVTENVPSRTPAGYSSPPPPVTDVTKKSTTIHQESKFYHEEHHDSPANVQPTTTVTYHPGSPLLANKTTITRNEKYYQLDGGYPNGHTAGDRPPDHPGTTVIYQNQPPAINETRTTINRIEEHYPSRPPSGGRHPTPDKPATPVNYYTSPVQSTSPPQSTTTIYKFSNTTTSIPPNKNPEDHELLLPKPFPTEAVQLYPSNKPANNNVQTPPKKLEDLMASFSDTEREVLEDIEKREKEQQKESPTVKKEVDFVPHTPPKVKSKNVAGPPVYYPPGAAEFTKKEEASAAMSQSGGGGWQKAKAKYEYEASGKSKSKSSSGKAVVPVCLPLCCALPCVIM